VRFYLPELVGQVREPPGNVCKALSNLGKSGQNPRVKFGTPPDHDQWAKALELGPETGTSKTKLKTGMSTTTTDPASIGLRSYILDVLSLCQPSSQRPRIW
jgi:hypothetical protein